jgi:dTDP-4-dehydrorhamnose reductase
MRILILGGDGMLGHRLLRHLGKRHEVLVTLRQPLAAYAAFGLFTAENSRAGVDVRDDAALKRILNDFHPAAIVNAAGIVKQRTTPNESIANIEINALLPHRVSLLSKDFGARLLHFSTDCVFSGTTGNYTETGRTDPDDLYGRTKLVGEVADSGCITLRTSIIGRELSRKKGLLEWFLAQRGVVHGYRLAIYSGFTTHEMARIVEKILVERPQASGVYHVSSEPISKYHLLCLIRDKLGLPITVLPDDTVRCNRSLDSTHFRNEFGYSPPSWDKMIEELAQNGEEP